MRTIIAPKYATRAPVNDSNRSIEQDEVSETRIARGPSPWVYATAMLFAILFPTVVTWGYFVALADQPAIWQQLAAGFGKSIQFLFPLIWVIGVCRRPFALVKWSRRGLGFGVGFGCLVVAAMFAMYLMWLQPSRLFDSATEQILKKVTEIGISSRVTFLSVGLFYAFVHSGLEEYYWRWFVYGELKQQMPRGWAILFSSLGFMAHHVILLGIYFGFSSPLAYFFSAAVAVGGAVWAWWYDRQERILPCWVSHMIVDAGIFGLGYLIVFRA